MLFAYRTGKNPLTLKAWRKLEAAERQSKLETSILDMRREQARSSVDQADFEKKLEASSGVMESLSYYRDRELARAAEDDAAESDVVREDSPPVATLQSLSAQIKDLQALIRQQGLVLGQILEKLP